MTLRSNLLAGEELEVRSWISQSEELEVRSWILQSEELEAERRGVAASERSRRGGHYLTTDLLAWLLIQ